MPNDQGATVETTDLDKLQQQIRPNVAIGRPGLKQAGGHLYEEYLPQLSGKRGIKVFKEMSENDAIVGGILFAISAVLSAVDWHVEPDDEDLPEDREAADFVETCMADMSNTWSETVVEALSMLVFGWSFMEVTWKRRDGQKRDRLMSSRHEDGRWGWAGFDIRAQDSLLRWEFDGDARLTGMWQLPPPDFQSRFIPLEKAVLFRLNPKKGSPEGASLLRTAYRSWYFKRRLQELEAIGIERDLAGLPVLYGDPSMFMSGNEEKLESYKRLVRDLKRDEQEGVILPSLRDDQGHLVYELTLLSTGSRRQADTTDIINRYNAEIAMSAMSDFMLLGHSRTGTYALGVTKTDLWATAFGYVLDTIRNEVNERELPRLLALNGMTGRCRLEHGKPGNVDVEKFSKMLVNLGAAGMPLGSQDGEFERFVFDQVGLPAPEGSAAPLRPDPDPPRGTPEMLDDEDAQSAA